MCLQEFKLLICLPKPYVELVKIYYVTSWDCMIYTLYLEGEWVSIMSGAEGILYCTYIYTYIYIYIYIILCLGLINKPYTHLPSQKITFKVVMLFVMWKQRMGSIFYLDMENHVKMIGKPSRMKGAAPMVCTCTR